MEPSLVTPAEVLDSVRGAVNLVLDELDGEDADVCRYQTFADTTPVFAAVTIEGCTQVELPTDSARLAWFDVPILNGPTIRIMAFIVREAPGG